jgi:hypothetical protein
MEGYCVKCRSKKEMKNPKTVTTKNGQSATSGECHICGTKMYRLGLGKSKGKPPASS